VKYAPRVPEGDLGRKSEQPRRLNSSSPPVVRVFEPRRGWILLNWGEIWAGRALLVFLVWRDIKVRYKQTILGATWAVIQLVTQFWMFASPIAYPSSLLAEPWRTLYGLNPMVGVVEGFRWALLDTNTAPGPMIAVSSVAALALLIGGAFYFRRMEKTFADLV
jgi:ABC-type polysaccharide/polyol phosphate export permease